MDEHDREIRAQLAADGALHGGYHPRMAAVHRANAWQPAMLEDRIRFFEGWPQLFGTQLKPDDAGRLLPYPIEDPEHVEERRRAVGLEPLFVVLARAEPAPLPGDRARFQRAYEAWLRRVGWQR